LKKECCLRGAFRDSGDTPANLLCELSGHLMPCTSCFYGKWVEDVCAGQFGIYSYIIIMPPAVGGGALRDTAIRPSVCPSVPALGAQLPQDIGTLAACRLAVYGRRTRPRTDVDPPRVELPSAGAYRLAAPGAITC